MCVYEGVYVRVRGCVCVCEGLRVGAIEWVSKVCLFVCAHIYTHTHTPKYGQTTRSPPEFITLHARTHKHTHTHTRTHTHTHTNTHRNTHKPPDRSLFLSKLTAKTFWHTLACLTIDTSLNLRPQVGHSHKGPAATACSAGSVCVCVFVRTRA